MSTSWPAPQTEEPLESAPVDSQLHQAAEPRIATLMDQVWVDGASDLLILADQPPLMRIDGKMRPVPGWPVLTEQDTALMVKSLLSEEQKRTFKEQRQVDFSTGWGTTGRFRGNAYHQLGTVSVALRAIPNRIPSLPELGTPPALDALMKQPYGLVLVTGPTGSGKSTTLAAMVNAINAERECHILTIEDPVEYLHNPQKAAVSQREVGVDVPDFPDGLRAALREDPDVILVGEMRDLESIAITITLAETGHLVFATLHTNDSAQTLDRVIDVFPAERRAQIQIQLSATLQGVVSQRLLAVPGGGRVAAFEVLLATEAVRNLVREGKTRQLRNVIGTSRNLGMQTLENDLTRLVAAGLITYADAEAISLYPREILVQGPVPGQVAALYDPFGREDRPVPVPAHIR